MNNVKIALTLLSIAIVVGPLAGVVLFYRDNLVGLVVPPEIKNLDSGLSEGNLTNPQFINGSQFQLPTLVGEPQYNQETGAFSYPINFTNPLKTEISVDSMSAEIKFKDNNVILGNISITQPIEIAPGQSGIINATGNLDPEKVSQIKAQYSGDVNNIVLENVNIVVGGVEMHFDELDAGSLQGLGV
jgi:hypothetical protein